MALGKEKERSVYHVLYADEVRLDSLFAQIFDKLALKERVTSRYKSSEGAKGAVGISSIVSVGGECTNERGDETSTEYDFADARYFKILEELGIDLENPVLPTQIEADSTIVATRGHVSLCGSEGYASMVPLAKAFCEYLKFNKPVKAEGEDKASFQIRKKEHSEAFSDFHLTLNGMKFLESAKIPEAAMMTIDDRRSIYMPLKSNYMRMSLSQIAEIFGSDWPYEWIVVGYIYPYHKSSFNNHKKTFSDNGEEDFDVWTLSRNLSETLRALCSPKNVEMAMIPLLILQ